MSDVLMIPVTTVQPDLVTQTDVVVYVPLASKTAPGIVKLGEGLNVTKDGTISVNVTKESLGLENVDNTSDLEKPISTQVNNELISIKNDIKKVEALVEGQTAALALNNYSEVVDIFNNAATNSYKVGQIILVNKTDVPDLWVFSVENTHVDYAYVGDYDIVEQLEEIGTVQFGYYKLAQMESQEINLENYVNLDGVQTITGVKLFNEQLGIVNPANGDINLLKHINNNFLISASNGENIINIDEQLKKLYFYNKQVALKDDVYNNYVSFTNIQTLTDVQKEIARTNIGAGTGSGSGESVMLVWWRDAQ